MKSIFFFSATCAVALCLSLLASCGGKNTPAEPTPAAAADTTATAAPPAGKMAPKFEFEHFGSFDLAAWKQLPSKAEGEGDVEMKTEVYEMNGDTLEIEEVNMGEYGYETHYTLKGADGKVKKTRSLAFSNDPFAMTETVNDYTLTPAKQFSRTQELGQHYSQLGTLPTSVSGPWKEGEADKR